MYITVAISRSYTCFNLRSVYSVGFDEHWGKLHKMGKTEFGRFEENVIFHRHQRVGRYFLKTYFVRNNV